MLVLRIERDRPGEALVARVIVSNIAIITRSISSRTFMRGKVDIDRSMMAGWVGKMVWLVTPLAEADHWSTRARRAQRAR